MRETMSETRGVASKLCTCVVRHCDDPTNRARVEVDPSRPDRVEEKLAAFEERHEVVGRPERWVHRPLACTVRACAETAGTHGLCDPNVDAGIHHSPRAEVERELQASGIRSPRLRKLNVQGLLVDLHADAAGALE